MSTTTTAQGPLSKGSHTNGRTGRKDRVDLTGRRFGRLKVLRLLRGDHRRGRRWWKCVCKCGRKTRVDTSSLVMGKVRSCGCARGGGPSNKGRLTKAKARRAHAKSKKIFQDGWWWYSPGLARRYLAVSYLTLQNWGGSCPWLNGQGIESRPLKGPLGRTLTYYSETSLNRIRAARSGREHIPEYDGLDHLAKAVQDSGRSVSSLRNARPGKPTFQPGKDRLGRATQRSYVPRGFGEQLKAKRAPALGPDDITVRETAEILDCTRGWVKQLVKRGILKRVKRGLIPASGKHRNIRHRVRAGGLVLSRKEVEGYREKRAGVSRTPRLDYAVNLLRTILGDGQPHLAKDVQRQVIEQGVSLKVVMAAAHKLSVKIERLQFRRPYYWRLPASSLPANGKGAAPKVPEPAKEKRRRGPKVRTDSSKDQQVWDAWHTGQHRNYASLGAQLGFSARQIEQALDRFVTDTNRILRRSNSTPKFHVKTFLVFLAAN